MTDKVKDTTTGGILELKGLTMLEQIEKICSCDKDVLIRSSDIRAIAEGYRRVRKVNAKMYLNHLNEKIAP